MSYQSILERECGYSPYPPPRVDFLPKLEPVLQKGYLWEHLGIELAAASDSEVTHADISTDSPGRARMLPGDRPRLHDRDFGPDGE